MVGLLAQNRTGTSGSTDHRPAVKLQGVGGDARFRSVALASSRPNAPITPHLLSLFNLMRIYINLLVVPPNYDYCFFAPLAKLTFYLLFFCKFPPSGIGRYRIGQLVSTSAGIFGTFFTHCFTTIIFPLFLS